MDPSSLAEIDIPIVLGVVVSIIVMSTAAIYDHYKGNRRSDTSMSNSLGSPGNSMNLPNLKVSDPFESIFQKIKGSIRNKTIPKENGKPEVTTDPKTNESGINAIFSNLRSKILSIKQALPIGDNRVIKKLPDKNIDSKSDLSAEKGSNVDFDVDEIVRDKKSDLDFDDDLINEMVTSGSLHDLSNMSKPDFGNTLNEDLSIDIDDFDFGFDEDGTELDDAIGNEFSFEMHGDDNPYANGVTQVMAVDNFSFDDDNDDFIESLKKDIVIDQKKKIDFMSELKGVDLNIEDIKTELEGVLTDLRKCSTY